MIDNSMKGVTPVVATVLLIGITFLVGGILVTQVEGLLSGGNTDLGLSADFNIQSVYKEGGTMHIAWANTGQNAINESQLDVFVDGQPTNECFTSPTNTVNVEESGTCSTGQNFPGATKSKTITIESSVSESELASYTCRVERSDAQSC